MSHLEDTGKNEEGEEGEVDKSQFPTVSAGNGERDND